MWLVFEPLTHVLLIMAIIGSRTRTVLVNIELPVFLLTGLLPFFLFRNLARKLPSAIGANRSLFAYRQVIPIDALIARALVEIGLYAIVYFVALVLLGWLGYHAVPRAPIELMIVTLVLITLGVGLGLLFAIMQHNRPKVATFIGFVFLPLYFASGVIFQIHNLAPSIRHWLLFNPVLHLIELSRAYFIPRYTALPDVSLAYPASWALVVTALGLSLYRVYRHRFLMVG